MRNLIITLLEGLHWRLWHWMQRSGLLLTCADAPNTDGLNRAAMQTAALSKEALDWYKEIYAEQAPMREQAAATAQRVSDAQIKGMEFATNQARELDAYNKETIRPVEQALVQEAATFDTPGRRMQEAAAAGATVDDAFGDVTEANNRALARAGVAPGTLKAQALAADTAIEQAKARGGAMTTAVRNVEQQGYARKADVANLGRGLASSQATQQQIATSTGNAGAGNAVTALNAGTSGNAVMGQGFGTSMQALTASGNLYGQQAQIQQSASASNNALLGSLGMAAGYAFSDEKVKSGTGRMVDTASKLAEIEATPIHDGWTYDPAMGGPDDGGQQHTGPMAGDVQRISGEQAAPGGKVISLPDRMGRIEAAMQELSGRVKTIQKKAA